MMWCAPRVSPRLSWPRSRPVSGKCWRPVPGATAAGGDRARIEDRTALVVDDEVATGSTARAACQIARARGGGTDRAGGACGAAGLDRAAGRGRRRTGMPAHPVGLLRDRAVLRRLLPDR